MNELRYQEMGNQLESYLRSDNLEVLAEVMRLKEQGTSGENTDIMTMLN